jgi:hypothetical protein
MNSNTFAFVFMFENLSFRLRLALTRLAHTGLVVELEHGKDKKNR